jgi:hypothetical protein
MNAMFTLLAVSAIVGVILGFYFSWVAILASGLVLAILSATVLQYLGFGSLPGIAIIIACLSVNQMAYLVGAALAHGGPSVPLSHDDRADRASPAEGSSTSSPTVARRR